MADEKIPVRAEMYRRKGEWNLLVRGPEWLVYDFARSASLSRTRSIWLHNYGGGMGGYSFLLGTMQMTGPTRRERFLHWLFRIPPRKLDWS